MNRLNDNVWFRTFALLGALCAGAVMTQAIPSYEAMAAMQKEPVRESAASRPTEHASQGVSQIHASRRDADNTERSS